MTVLNLLAESVFSSASLPELHVNRPAGGLLLPMLDTEDWRRCFHSFLLGRSGIYETGSTVIPVTFIRR